MKPVERLTLIELLVFMTGKAEAYFFHMSDEELNGEYDRLME
ncbi:hypothetical protein [Psychrobacillus sp. FSL K6-1267]